MDADNLADPLVRFLEPYGIGGAPDSAEAFVEQAGLATEAGRYADGLMEYQTVRLTDRGEEVGKGVAPDSDRALLLAIADFIEKHPEQAPGPNPA